LLFSLKNTKHDARAFFKPDSIFQRATANNNTTTTRKHQHKASPFSFS